MRRFIFLFLAIPIVAHAESHLPPSPQYFNDFAIALSKAEQFAQYCDDIELDQNALQRMFEELEQRLTSDGITHRPIVDAVIFPPSEESDVIMAAWLDEIRDRGDPEVEFCKAGAATIAVKSDVAAFLVAR